jgi:uncharacterized membrane protein
MPALSVTAALVLGTWLAGLRVEPVAPFDRILFSGDADAAQALLSVVAGSLITVTSLVFSLTVLTLQIASSQYSPRLLRNFLQDRGNQVVLSTFLSTFAYSLAVLRTVQTTDVPRLAVSGVLVLVLASLAMLVYVIHHIAHSIRLDTIMRSVERRTLAAVDRNHPETIVGAEWRTQLPDAPASAVAIRARGSGFLQALDPAGLLEMTAEHDAVIRFAPMVGDQVVAGAPIAWVWPRVVGGRPLDPAVFERPVDAVVQLGYERTLHQDVAFGIRQFVDIAVKGTSPAINDPATAVEAIGHLAVGRDGAVVRVAVPRREFAGYLDLACSQIRRFGAAEPDVAMALLHLLQGVAENTLSDDRRAVIRQHADRIVAEAERTVHDPGDLHAVHGACRAVVTSLDHVEVARLGVPGLTAD